MTRAPNFKRQLATLVDKLELVANKRKTTLRVAKTIVSVNTTKSRKTRLFASFASSKKRLKAFI